MAYLTTQDCGCPADPTVSPCLRYEFAKAVGCEFPRLTIDRCWTSDS